MEHAKSLVSVWSFLTTTTSFDSFGAELTQMQDAVVRCDLAGVPINVESLIALRLQSNQLDLDVYFMELFLLCLEVSKQTGVGIRDPA